MRGVATGWGGCDRHVVEFVLRCGAALLPRWIIVVVVVVAPSRQCLAFLGFGTLDSAITDPLINNVSLPPVSVPKRSNEVRNGREDERRGECCPCVGIVPLVLWICGIRAAKGTVLAVRARKRGDGTYSYVCSSVGMTGGPARDIVGSMTCRPMVKRTGTAGCPIYSAGGQEGRRWPAGAPAPQEIRDKCLTGDPSSDCARYIGKAVNESEPGPGIPSQPSPSTCPPSFPDTAHTHRWTWTWTATRPPWRGCTFPPSPSSHY